MEYGRCWIEVLCGDKSKLQLWQSLNFGKVIRERISKTADNRNIKEGQTDQFLRLMAGLPVDR